MKKSSFFLLFLLIGCSSSQDGVKEASNLIPKDTMVLILRDLTKLESHIRIKYPQIQLSYKTVQNSSMVIFKKYEIDTMRFNQSLEYYGADQKEMQGIFSQVLDSINRELTEISTLSNK